MRRVAGGANAKKAIKGQFSDRDFHTMLWLNWSRRETGSNLFQYLIPVHAGNWRLKRLPCPIHQSRARNLGIMRMSSKIFGR